MGRKWNPPGLIGARYYWSDAPVNIIQGPIESGKSVASCLRLFKAMCLTPRSKGSNLRKSRWLVSRNTYPDLRNSTINTFLDWFPAGPPGKGYGKFYDTEPYVYEFKYMDVEAEIIFESYMDDSEPVLRSLKSKEYTGAWFNEAQFTSRKLVAAIIERTGRYPRWDDISYSWREGGEKWKEYKAILRAKARKEFLAGKREFDVPDPMPDFEQMRIDRRWFIGDMNAPRTSDHWVLVMRGDVPMPETWDESEKRAHRKPEDWQFFVQPPAVFPDAGASCGYVINPGAENLKNMAPGRYLDLTEGRSTKEIDRELRNKVVIEAKGEPVFPGFRRDKHVADGALRPLEGGIVYGGADFGLTPAWVFGQKIGRRWVLFREMVETNKTAAEFAPDVKSALAKWFPWIVNGDGFDPDLLRLWGDPAGGWSGQAHRQSVFDVYRSHGMLVRSPAAQDAPGVRIGLTRDVMARYADDEPVLVIDPCCTGLIAAFDGGYTLKRMPGTKANEVMEKINKDRFSHVAEAAQYLFWGGGEARVMAGRVDRDGETLAPKRVNVIAAREGRKISGVERRGRDLFRFTRPGR